MTRFTNRWLAYGCWQIFDSTWLMSEVRMLVWRKFTPEFLWMGLIVKDSLAALCIENAVTVTLYGSISSCVSHLGPIYSFIRNSDDFLWAKINYLYSILTFLVKIFCGQCNTKNIDVIIKMLTPIYQELVVF